MPEMTIYSATKVTFLRYADLGNWGLFLLASQRKEDVPYQQENPLMAVEDHFDRLQLFHVAF